MMRRSRFLRYTFFLLALSLWIGGCTKTSDQDSETDLGPQEPTEQERLCDTYPDGIACPTLPSEPQLEDGTVFSAWQPSPCPAGTMPELGRSGCMVLGDPCPAGQWPEDLPDEGLRYVTPGGTGDGLSKETAAGSIQAMLNETTSGTTIALSKGTFEEHIEIARGQHLVGACVRDTVIAGWSRTTDQVVGITGSGESSLQNVSVTGPTVGIWIWSAGAPIELQGVLVDASTRQGLLVADAEVSATMLSVSNTQPLANGNFGRGIQVSEGAKLTISRGLVDGNRDIGVAAGSPGTALILEDVLIRNTLSQESDGTFGYGMQINTGASADVKRSLLDANHDVAVSSSGSSTSLKLHDVVIRDTQAQISDGGGGRGLDLKSGVSVELSRVVVSQNRDVGLIAIGSGTEISANDLHIQDTSGRESTGVHGRGMDISEGATITLSRGRFSRNREVAVRVSAAANGDLEDIVIEASQPQSLDDAFGRGIEFIGGGALTLKRGLLRDNRDVGIVVGNAGTSAVFEDVIVQNTGSQVSENNHGRGLQVTDGAQLSYARGLITNNRDVGAFVSDAGTSVSFEDVRIELTDSEGFSGLGGQGLNAQLGASVTLERSSVWGNREAGIFVSHADTVVTLKESEVIGTRVALCDEDPTLTCPFVGQGFGDGILVMGGAHLELQDFEISNNARVGLFFYDPVGTVFEESPAFVTGSPSLEVLRGNVFGNQYGINFREGDLGPSSFIDKQVGCYDNLSTTDGCYSELEMEVPSPGSELEGVAGVSR